MFTLFGSSSNADKDSSAEVIASISSWCVCSIGMMVFNKVAVQQFPAACLLVALQMAFCSVTLLILPGSTFTSDLAMMSSAGAW